VGLWAKRDDMVVHETDPYNAEPPPRALADRVLTPIDSFYSRNHGPIPLVDADAWTLTVDGLVERPLSLALADLQKRFVVRSLVVTLQCAGNRRIGLIEVRDIPGEAPWGPCATSTAEWTGVSLADVLADAGVTPQAQHVAFAAPDVSERAEPVQPYGSSIGIKKALGPEVLLAWAMNGQPLPPAHGAPVRVIVPGYIGARSVKWVRRVTAQAAPSDNYFQANAYRLLPPEADPSQAGPGDGLSLGAVAVNADFLRPDNNGTVPPGPTEVSGYAFDGGRRWVQAELDDQVSPWAWRLWRTTLDLSAGDDVEVTARAWDTSAASQPESAASLWNPKGYVNNSWAHLRLRVR
jgi:sulfite oxidase